jgi:hypothetical protein
MAVERLTFEMNAVGNAVPEMKRVQGQLQQLDRATSVYNRRMSSTTGSLTRATRGFGLLGLQVQDVAVQASMGTDALRIFSMQGPQILSLFGPLGMIAGAVAGVGAGVLLANGGLDGLSFDFRKFATDMAPLLDLLRPAIEAIGTAFRFVGGLIVDAFNGILNGARMAGVVLSHLPAIATEALTRIGARLSLIGNGFKQFANEVQFRFQMAMISVVSNVMNGANAVNEILNQAFDLGLRTDLGTAMLEGMNAEVSRTTSVFYALQNEAQALQNALDQDNEAVAALRRELENLTGIDIRSYFTRAAAAADGEGGSLTTALTEAQQRAQDLANTMQQNFESGFMSIIDGTKSLKDAFRDMAKSVIAELYRVLVVKRLVGSFDVATGAGSGIVGFLGRMFGGMRAQGGAVSGNKAYMVGEKGPEMIVPGTSGRVIPNNQLGGGGQPIVINQTINVSTGVQQTVRAEIKQLMPQIAESAKSAVVDAKRRGGSYGRAFA